MTKRIAIALVLVLASVGLRSAQDAGDSFKAPPPAFADPDRAARLAAAYPEVDRIIREFAASQHIPGAAWGIVVDGTLAHSGATGYRDVESRAPASVDTVFRIASMTKSFTAIAILKLRDEGKLSSMIRRSATFPS